MPPVRLISAQFRPFVGSPHDVSLYKNRCTFKRHAVAMTDEDVLVVEMVGGTMSERLERLVVSLNEQVASAQTHIHAEFV